MSEKEMRELDVWIAINLYGWEWLEREHNEAGVYIVRKALFCPVSEDWIRWNFNGAQWTPAQGSTLLFSDWDMVCSERDDDNRKGQKRRCGLPHYTTDPAAAMQVLEKCLEKWAVCLTRRDDGKIGAFCMGFDGLQMVQREEYETGDTLPMAICLLAKRMFF